MRFWKYSFLQFLCNNRAVTSYGSESRYEDMKISCSEEMTLNRAGCMINFFLVKMKKRNSTSSYLLMLEVPFYDT